MKFICKHFSELSLDQLYQAFQLRQEVFVVEQNCPYIDADGRDQESYHILHYDQGKLTAYSRVIPPGISYPDYSSIGRVVTNYNMRGTGLGKQIMQESIDVCRKLFPNSEIKISAQAYAIQFYEKFNFEKIGEEYLEDEIPHIAMILKN